MDPKVMLLVAAYLLAHLLAVALPFFVNNIKFQHTAFAREKVSVRLPFLTLTVTGISLCRLGSYWICYSAILNLPLVPSWVAFALTLLIISQTSDWLLVERPTSTSEISEIPLNLVAVETELLKAQVYTHRLTNDIATTIDELKKKEDLRVQLESEIKKKEMEHQEWQKLSEGQREYFVRKIFEYTPKAGWGKDIILVIVGFVLNIVASAVWSLLGSPGKVELLELLNKWLPLLKGT